MRAMTPEAPPFWWEPAGIPALALSPIAWIYGAVAARRLDHGVPPRVAAPVLCIGNFTVGGSGKTPVAIAFAHEAEKLGARPGFLTRGHGGTLSKPKIIDPGNDNARLTGDEPLLLARHAPVAAGKDRLAAAQLLLKHGCDFLIMDDGFQSRRLHYDYALMVVDAGRGNGNGHVIPAGPLRAPLVVQMRHCDGLMVVGNGDAAVDVVRSAARAAKPVFEAGVSVRNGSDIAGHRFLAFAGIGNPVKFFDTVVEAGGWLSDTRAFPDHHPYSDRDIAELVETAETMGVDLVTTEKDAVRFAHGTEAARSLLERLTILEIGIAFEPANTPAGIIAETIERFAMRGLEPARG